MLAIKLCIFSLALSVQASRVVLETSASFRAKMWLKSHDPSADEAGMADLKNQDPNAFAIVQALLTKKSLGLLDPNHPSASMTASTPREHKSFQEEAEQAGLTQDSPSPAVSEMEMHSSMPYPTVGSSSSQPYPEVHASHDPWNYKSVHSDDDLVASVVGNDPAPAAPASDDSLSLSATSQQMQQSMPAPVEHHAAPPASSNFMDAMPTMSWGNPLAGQSSEVPAAAAPVAQAAQEDNSEDSTPSLSLSAVRNQEEQRMGITENAPVAPAAPAMYTQPAPSALEKDNQIGLPSLNWDRPQTRAETASLAIVSAPVVQPAPVASNSYLANTDLSPTTALSSIHSQMSSYRSNYRMNMHASDAVPSSDSILALRKQNMGNSYDSFLKQARTNRWKRAMDVTLNMKTTVGGANNMYLNDLS
jgi:hypothetical protein